MSYMCIVNNNCCLLCTYMTRHDEPKGNVYSDVCMFFLNVIYIYLVILVLSIV